LQEIHKAGILHGDIRRQNLLIDDWGHASIVDFDRSVKESSTKAKEQEFQQLCDLLNVN
jgi:RIO-like serine/threonine protein kinase